MKYHYQLTSTFYHIRYLQVAAAANEVTKAGLTVAELSCDGIGVLDFNPTDPGGCRVALANVFLTPIGKVSHERSSPAQ